MPRTQPTRDRRTKLSVFVRELRAQKRLTQEQLQQLLGVTQPQYVSKVEVGAIRRPQRQFLEALGKLTDTPIETLEEMCQQAPAESAATPAVTAGYRLQPGRFSLASTHCLWGAPIFLAAYRGMLKDFRVASFMEGPNASAQVVSRLQWIHPKNGSIGPVPGPLDASHALDPLSAADVVRLLEEQKIEVAVVPGSVMRDYSRFLRVGSLVDSPTGCFLLLDEEYSKMANVGSTDKGQISTDELGMLLKQHGKESGASKRAARTIPAIGVEDSSLAKEFLIRACDSAGLQYRKHLWLCLNRDFATRSFPELKEACKQKASGQELIGIITWDPHATWLASMHGKPEPKKIPIYLSPNTLGQPTHISFDVIVNRTTSLSHDFREALLSLMGALWRNARTINQAESSEEYLRALAVYFGFGSEGSCDAECLERTDHAINCILYSVRLDMEFFL